jgi:hypothetical protein
VQEIIAGLRRAPLERKKEIRAFTVLWETFAQINLER